MYTFMYIFKSRTGMRGDRDARHSVGPQRAKGILVMDARIKSGHDRKGTFAMDARVKPGHDDIGVCAAPKCLYRVAIPAYAYAPSRAGNNP